MCELRYMYMYNIARDATNKELCYHDKGGGNNNNNVEILFGGYMYCDHTM